jgi:hypothetical protein
MEDWAALEECTMGFALAQRLVLYDDACGLIISDGLGGFASRGL